MTRLATTFCGLALAVATSAHHETRPLARAEAALADGSRSTGGAAVESHAMLRVRLEDADTRQPVGGMIRVTPVDGPGVALPLAGLFERPAGWFSTAPEAELKLAPGTYRVEATRGTDYGVASGIIDCTAGEKPELTLTLARFYRPEAAGLHSTNTHLHLLLNSGAKVGVDLQNRRQTDDYLRTVGASDKLDLVYLSYVGSPGATIISNDYTNDDLRRLSNPATAFVNAVEHRHGGVRAKVAPVDGKPVVEMNKNYPVASTIVTITYGHVMLLDLMRRSMPASVGPGLADDSRVTDGVSLQPGIKDALSQGAGVIWCHGTFGLEAIPDWFAGLIQAQNIYDGGSEGTFETAYYPLLNAGLKVPFSAGTDWGITDFSRVYVAAPAEFSSKVFLKELAQGRSYMTNEPFLEFQVGAAVAGDTVRLAQPGRVRVRGRVVGRSDFVRAQVVRNGRVVHQAPSRAVDGHYEAAVDVELPVEESGWIALRVPPVQKYEYRSKYAGPGTNIFGKAIFAHTSPVYLSVADRPVFDRAALEDLIARNQTALKQIDEMGVFANDAERAGIRGIYLETDALLRALLANEGRRPRG